MKNKFDTPKFVDHSIFDLDDKKIGELRVKPNAILWKPAGQHKKWYKVSLEDFINIAESKEKIVKK